MTIVQKENPILRSKAREVPISEITSGRISNILKEMRSALTQEPDGVAIAAPQIGHELRIFIISKRAFELDAEKPQARDEGIEEKPKNLIFINPTILRLSKKKEWVEEGCLSIRWLYGFVKRSVKATVRAYNEKGEVFERGGSGILAQIFQHEIDHLDGVLFTDKARDIHEMLPKEE